MTARADDIDSGTAFGTARLIIALHAIAEQQARQIEELEAEYERKQQRLKRLRGDFK